MCASTGCRAASSSSMKCAEVVVHKLTDAGVKRLCFSHVSIKQEAASEDIVHVGRPNFENPPTTKMVKNEVPDDELEDITVKEEPIDWHQEPQNRMSAASGALTFKKEVEDTSSEARSRLIGSDDELRVGCSGACNTSAVQQRLAGTSQGSVNLQPFDVSSSCISAEVNSPDRLKSVCFLCAHCDYSSTLKSKLELHLRDEHKLGFDFKCKSSSYSGLFSKKLNTRLEGKNNDGIMQQLDSFCEKKLMRQQESAKKDFKKFHNCELCDYSSANKSDVKKHQSRKHSYKKQFKCEQCAFETAYESSLKFHQARKHSIGALQRCELCDYFTARNYNMKMYVARKHNVGNLLKCELCVYSTCWSGNLKLHQATKHKLGNLLKCELCDYSTYWQSSLKLHQASKHS